MIQRGDVYFASLGYCTGSEQGGERPVIVVQNNKGNTFSPTVLVACITKRRKKNLPTHVILPKELGFEYDSVVMTEQIKTLDKSRIGNFVCHVPDEYMEMVDKSLRRRVFKSLRRRVFSDIYRELKRQFQVGTYKAIKRSQCEVALEIINDYEPPLALEEEIRDCNAQESFVSEIA